MLSSASSGLWGQVSGNTSNYSNSMKGEYKSVTVEEAKAGPLLTTQTGTTAAYAEAPFYDGNGNILGLLNLAPGSTTGQVIAEYEYTPFGQLLRATGPDASFPWRFSTKYQDAFSGLAYYGYRWYDSVDGRWLGRDPIGEEGGRSLYGMAGNSPLVRIDLLGLIDYKPPEDTLPHTVDKFEVKASRKTPEYVKRAHSEISFEQGDRKCPCKDVKLIQFVKQTVVDTSGATELQDWKVDYPNYPTPLPVNAGPSGPYPYYPGNPTFPTGSPVIQDDPGTESFFVRLLKQDFEICAVCTDKTGWGKIFGCTRWGWSVSDLLLGRHPIYTIYPGRRLRHSPFAPSSEVAEILSSMGYE